MIKNLKRLMPCLAFLAVNFASCSTMFVTSKEETIDSDFFNGDGVVNANYSNSQRTINTYSATWSRPDGTVLKIDSNLQEGTTPVFEGDPTFSSSETTYRFVRWNPEPAPIYSNAFYTAVYEEESRYFYLERDYINDGYIVTGPKEIKEELTIPTEFKGKPVTSVYFSSEHSWNGVKKLNTGDSIVSMSRIDIPLEIEELVLGKNVQEISDFFFYESPNIKSVIFNNKLKEIPAYMFAGCNNLTTVKFGNGLEKVGNSAFQYCSSLKDIVFPESLQDVGNNVFYKSGVTSITFPETMDSIGYDLFHLCTSLKSVKLPEYVSYMDSGNLFSGCSQLESVSLPKNISAIKMNAFSNCAKLNNVVIPSGVTLIERCAFAGCSSLTNISLAEGIERIQPLAFDGCPLKSLILPKGLKRIDSVAIANCENLVSISIPDSVNRIDDDAFYHVPSLFVINYEGSKQDYNSINIANPNSVLNNTLKNYQSYSANDTMSEDEFLVVYLDENRNILEVQKHRGDESFEYTGETPVKEADESNDYMFSGWELTKNSSNGCKEFTPRFTPIEKKYTLTFDYKNGKTVQSLLNYGEAVNYPEDPENGEKIFIGWDTDLDNMPDRNVTISAQYITRTTPGQVYRNGKGRVKYKNWETLVNENIVRINNNVLVDVLAEYDNKNRGVFILPNTIKEIGNNAFDSVDNYQEIIMQEGVTTIGDSAFLLSDVQKLAIPNSVTKIGPNAFSSSKLISVTFPEGLTSLPECLFYGCNNLIEVNLPSTLTNIDFGAFASCPNLTSINLPSSIKTYKNAIFFASGLTKIEINQGAQSIGNGMFSDCSNLTEVTLPSTLTSVGTNLFEDCNSLTKVNYRGSKTQFDNLGFDAATLEKLASVTITYNYVG